MASAFFSLPNNHRFTTISTDPELVRLKYIDTPPTTSTKCKGTILLIHGFPQSSYQFRHVLPLLSTAGYRTITPDYRGTADSSRPSPSRGTPSTPLATDLHTLITSPSHLNITAPIHVVGHDIGGMIAHAYATLFPTSTASVTWGECPLPGTTTYESTKNTPQLFHFNFHCVPDLPEQLIAGNERAYLKHFFDKLACNAGAITPSDLDFYAAQYRQPQAVRGAISVYRTFETDARRIWRLRGENGKCTVRCWC